MTSQEFINDMQKLFAVCAIYNSGAKIGQFGIMDNFDNLLLFEGHINFFVHSQSRCQPLPFSFMSFHFSIFEQVTDTAVPKVSIYLLAAMIGKYLSSSACRQ